MVQGMGSVVATVSGYHGAERSKLIKLIDDVGANYVGKMSRSTTHLICWEFKGSKYDLAKKFGTIILNHRWLEECIKEGKRIPEHMYTLQSGKEVGSITLNRSVVTQTPSVLAENKLLLNKRNMGDRLKDVIDLDSDEIENDGWDVDCLLDENLFPGPGSRKSARQSSERIMDQETSKENRRSKANNRMSTREIQQRSDNDKSMSMDLPESSRRSRRLVRKNVKRNVIGSASIDVERQSGTLANVNDLTCTSSLSNNSNDLWDDMEANLSGRLKTDSAGCGKSDDEEANHLDDTGAPGDTGINSKTSIDGENSNEQLKKGDEVNPSTRLTTSGELSCVICWTEFSSTRGVLPCGHRFCFSCIQNWADHMASNGKGSKCPLCKASFSIITKVDDAASLDQKIYSQTIPNPSSTQDIFIVAEGRACRSENEIPLPSVCCNCQSLYPEDLLIYCQICQTNCIHSYCLDPPLFPWTCITCRDRRLFYHR